MSEHLPPPRAALIAATTPGPDELVVLSAGTQLLRVHLLGGAHPRAWDQFRSYGPTTARFDHHPPPPKVHPMRSVLYATIGAQAFTAAIAEFFQDDGGGVGPIDRTRRFPALTAFTLVEPLRLLDLDSGWVTRSGGNQAITSGGRYRSREWARAIYRHHPSVQGLIYRSSVWGPGRCVAVWERGLTAMPAGNDLHRTLADPALDTPLAVAADRLGTVLLP